VKLGEGESHGAGNTVTFSFEIPPVGAGMHRPQCCAVKEGSNVAKTHMTRS
jgi:hypothetical protein